MATWPEPEGFCGAEIDVAQEELRKWHKGPTHVCACTPDHDAADLPHICACGIFWRDSWYEEISGP